MLSAHSERPRRLGCNSRRCQLKSSWITASEFTAITLHPDSCNGSQTLRPQDTSAPQNWCRSLGRITNGAVSHRNCPGSKCPGFSSSITALVSKCLVPRFWCRSVVRSVPKCPSVMWPKCLVTVVTRTFKA